jgi:hypothetical protein
MRRRGSAALGGGGSGPGPVHRRHPMRSDITRRITIRPMRHARGARPASSISRRLWPFQGVDFANAPTGRACRGASSPIHLQTVTDVFMLARLPSTIVIRLWAALLLAAIGVQAASPVGTPLEQRHGSAFSAATYEVALAFQRNEQSETREALVPQPAPPTSMPATPTRVEPAALAATLVPRPDSTGPPTPDSLAWRPAPRAPPIA